MFQVAAFSDISISQGSAAIAFNVRTTFCQKFTAKSVNERIAKIG